MVNLRRARWLASGQLVLMLSELLMLPGLVVTLPGLLMLLSVLLTTLPRLLVMPLELCAFCIDTYNDTHRLNQI